VAYGGAGGAPIAHPESWRNVCWLNWNKEFCMIVWRPFSNAFGFMLGKSSENVSDSRNSPMTVSACVVFMFVYIERASAVNNVAFSGCTPSANNSCTKRLERLVTQFKREIIFCDSKSTHLPRPCWMLPEMDVTSLVDQGSLWILASM